MGRTALGGLDRVSCNGGREGVIDRQQRQATAGALLELARAVERAAGARPADRTRGQDLHDYIVRFAAREATTAHWPLDGPLTLIPAALETAARVLQEKLRSRAFPALEAYERGTIPFTLVERSIRGVLE